MPDEIDIAQEQEQADTARSISSARAAAAAIPAGHAGECDYCGEWSPRIVGRACARCRDKRRLP